MLCRVFLPCHDEAARFVKLAAKPSCNYLEEDDFFLIIQVGFHQKNIRATGYIVKNFAKCSSRFVWYSGMFSIHVYAI